MSATATTVQKPARRFPPPCWTQTEALALIQSYKLRWYALRRGYLRTADWDAVADDVARLCPGAVPPKTSAQCRHKMEKLRQRYRAEKQRALSFPNGQFISTWFYFEAMDTMEKNGNGSGSGSNHHDEANTGKVIGNDFNLNSKINHQLNMNCGRGIRFKPFVGGVVGVVGDNDANLVTVASRANNVRALQSYVVGDDNDNDNEIEDACYEIGNNSGKTHKSILKNYGANVRPRKCSRIGSNSGHNHGYWNKDDDDDDDDDEDDVWVKMRKDRSCSMGYEYANKDDDDDDDDDGIGKIASSIRVLADGFVKMEKMKMEMVHEMEKMRMEAEMKRNKMLLESQKQIVEAFVKGLTENRK